MRLELKKTILLTLTAVFAYSSQLVAGGNIPFLFFPLPTTSVPGPTYGFFVITKTTYTGNLRGAAASGFEGANQKCYAELTDGAIPWLGKASAGTLTQAKVRAFLCIDAVCQSPIPNTVYRFASAQNSTAGGAEFTADATGRGPGNNANWSASTHFGTTEWIWTGRNMGTTTLWPLTGQTGDHCTSWTNGTSGNGVNGEMNRTDDYRWYAFLPPCSSTLRLICMIDP